MENYLMINGIKIELTPEQLEKVSQSIKTTPKWEDFGEISGYCLDLDSEIEFVDKTKSRLDNRNLFPTKEEAEACLALSQLCQWRDKYNNGWKADWSDNTKKYIITFDKNEIATGINYAISQVLSFKTEEIRDKFLKDFEILILQAKPLL